MIFVHVPNCNYSAMSEVTWCLVLKGKIFNDCIMDNETKMTLYRLATTYSMFGIVIHLYVPPASINGEHS